MNCSSQLLLCNKSPQHLAVFSAGVYSLTVDWVYGQSCGGSCLSFSSRLQSWCGRRFWSFLRPLTEKNELSIRCWAEASSPLYMMPIEMHIEYGHWPSTEPGKQDSLRAHLNKGRSPSCLSQHEVTFLTLTPVC